ncbi:MAG: S-methyl-5-thioribose-1-phosphate isomerase [Planctomycetota bacterium]
MRYSGQDYRTVWIENDTVCMIDQTRLPFEFRVVRSATFAETAGHIRAMTVRGAPAIGATAAYGLAQAAMTGGRKTLVEAAALFRATRPTARDLFAAVEHILAAAADARDPAPAAITAAGRYADASADECRRIGEAGAPLLGNKPNILTHCNAGWLACVDWGTALAPIYAAHRAGRKLFVYADETRPRGQGGRLTAWELANEGVPHAVIADNAAGHFMQAGRVDIVITGADRIAKNGDAANKIGTLEKAILARHFGIPFYIAAPWSTFDPATATGREIPIEERPADEVRFQEGPINGTAAFGRILVANPASPCLNPAFDVTPAALITGYITPQGILTADRLDELAE